MTLLIQKYAMEPVWAVVGASNDRAKYGNRIYRTLRAGGYRVYALNRRARLVEGDAAYGSLLDLPEPPTVVNLVVPPREASAVVQQAKAAGAKAVWFQPGAENAAASKWARENGLDVIEDCILVHVARLSPPAATEPNPSQDHDLRVTSPDPTTSTR